MRADTSISDARVGAYQSFRCLLRVGRHLGVCLGFVTREARRKPLIFAACAWTAQISVECIPGSVVYAPFVGCQGATAAKP